MTVQSRNKWGVIWRHFHYLLTHIYANVIGLLFTLIGAVITLRIFVLYKNHPDLSIKK